MTSKDVDNNPIVVSISCITYNHAPFIRQCLDGFMMQKTDFAFEVLIHDDASTDGTTEIIKEYEARYPDVIKPIYEEENQWVKGRRGSAVFNFPRARGKYIALCEGDDYWTDPLKLQKQVDFLEKNPEYVMCSHRFKQLDYETGELKNDWYGQLENDIRYTLDTIVSFKEWYTQPLSVLYRREALKIDILLRHTYSRDIVLFYHLLKEGSGMMFNDVMGVYRKHSSGIWTSSSFAMQRTSDIKACLSIYDVEKSPKAFEMLYNRAIQCRRMGLKYVYLNRNLLYETYRVIYKHYGLIKVLLTCVRTW